MENKKKWLVMLRMEQYTWIKDIAKKNGIKGSDILSEALDRIMNDNDFIEKLSETRLKVQLQELNDQAAEIETKRETLRRMYKETTGRERVRV